MIFKVCCREKLGCAPAEHAPRAALEAPPPLPLLPPRARGRWTLPGEEAPRSESGIVVARQSATCAPHLDARRDAFGVHIYIYIYIYISVHEIVLCYTHAGETLPSVGLGPATAWLLSFRSACH